MLAEYLSLGALHWGLVVFSLLLAMVLLGYSADKLVDHMVAASSHWGVPQVIIGATIVSLGTTLPEVMVSVIAALKGNPGMALGNSVGSIACDTGLILGLACLLGPIPINEQIKKQQGWMQFGSGCLLVLVCLPWTLSGLQQVQSQGSVLPQSVGFLFLALLFFHLYYLILQ